MDLSAYEANYQPMTFQSQQPKQAPRVSGVKAALASLLPTVGGALGAVGGSFVAPLAGTAVGGAAGSAAGEALKEKIMGQGYSGKSIATQAALGSLPGLFKGVKLGVQAVKGGKAIDEAAQGLAAARNGATAAQQAAETVIPKVTSTRLNPASVAADRQAVIANGKKIAGISEPTPTTTSNTPTLLDKFKAAKQVDAEKTASKPTLFGKLANGTKQGSQESKGIVVGASAGRGKVVTPDDAEKLNDFITNRAKQYGGIRSGKPINQAQDAQNVFNNVKAKLDETLNSIDRPLQQGEHQAIVDAATQAVSKNAAVTKGTATLGKFADKINNAKSIKDLEQIRREADDLAFTQAGAGKTSAAAQAHAVRDAIDGFITPMSAEYKAIKGDYPLARDALAATSKASKDAKGLKIPVVGDVGSQVLNGAKNGARAATVNVLDQADKGATVARPVAKSLFNQFTTRAAASPLTTDQRSNMAQMSQQTNPIANPAAMIPSTASNANTNIDTLSNNPDQNATDYVGAAKDALAKGDYKAFDAIMQLAALEDKRAAASGTGAAGHSKPTAQQYGMAQSGLTSLANLTQMLQNDPSVLQAAETPGQGLPLVGGYIANATGAGDYNAEANNVLDALARVRTGAAMTSSEEAFYKKLLPKAGDSPQTIQSKLANLQVAFNSFLGGSADATAGAQ